MNVVDAHLVAESEAAERHVGALARLVHARVDERVARMHAHRALQQPYLLEHLIEVVVGVEDGHHALVAHHARPHASSAQVRVQLGGEHGDGMGEAVACALAETVGVHVEGG